MSDPAKRDEGKQAHERLCRACRKPIHAEAKKCPECDSFQNWRRHFDITSSVLSLLVALASLTAVIIAQIQLFKPKKAQIVAIVAGSDAEVKGEDIEHTWNVLLANYGDAPALVESAILSVPREEVSIFAQIVEPKTDRVLVPYSQKVLTVKAVSREWLTEEPTDEAPTVPALPPPRDVPATRTRYVVLRFWMIDNKGVKRHVDALLPKWDWGRLLDNE